MDFPVTATSPTLPADRGLAGARPYATGHSSRIPLRGASRAWLAFSSVAILAFAISESTLSIVAAYIVFCGIGVMWMSVVNQLASRIFLIVFGSSVIAALALYFYFAARYGSPYWLGGSDELHYEEVGRAFAERFSIFEYGAIRGTLVGVLHNSVGYVYLNGLFAKFGILFGGTHTLIPRLFNAACLAFIAASVFRLGTRLGLRQSTAIGAALFAGCLPLMMWAAVQTFREMTITALLVGLVLIWTRARHEDVHRRRPSVFVLGGSLLIVIALLELRRGQAFAAALIAGIGMASYDPQSGRFLLVVRLMAVAAIASLVYYIFADAIKMDLAWFQQVERYYSTYRVEEIGIGGGLSKIVFQTPPPLGWLLRTAYAGVSPLPVVVNTWDNTWLSLGTIIHMLFAPFFFAGLLIAFRQQRWFPVFGAFLLLFVGMAMYTFQIRHIVQYLPFAILLTALGYERYRQFRYAAFAIMCGLGVTLAATYMALKAISG